MNIKEKIADLRNLFSVETNEEKLACAVEIIVKILRQEWKINRKNFSEEDILFLKSVSSKLININKRKQKSELEICVRCGRRINSGRGKGTANESLCLICLVEKVDMEMKDKVDIKDKKSNVIFPRRIDEGIAGSREDNKRMRRWRLS